MILLCYFNLQTLILLTECDISLQMHISFFLGNVNSYATPVLCMISNENKLNKPSTLYRVSVLISNICMCYMCHITFSRFLVSLGFSDEFVSRLLFWNVIFVSVANLTATYFTNTQSNISMISLFISCRGFSMSTLHSKSQI